MKARERVKDYACVACVDDTTFAAPSGDASGDDTECYAPFGDFSGQEVAKLKKLIGDSTIDAGTEQTCLKATRFQRKNELYRLYTG